MASVPVFSQKNFVPGFIINNSGERIEGKVDRQLWVHTPKTVTFESAGNTSIYGIKDIAAFGAGEDAAYVRQVITRTTRPTDIHLLRGKQYIDTVLTDTVFLQKISDGDWKLYQLNVTKVQFYLQRKDGSIDELRYVVDLKEDGQYYEERNYFRDQLNGALVEEGLDPRLGRKLPKMEYTESELVRFVDDVNRSKGLTVKSVERAKKKKKFLYPYLGAGLAVNSFDIKGGNEGDVPLGDLQFAKTVSPVFQGGVEFNDPVGLGGFVFRLELAWQQFSAKASDSAGPIFTVPAYEYSYNLKMNIFQPSLQAFYQVLRYPNCKVYLGPGIALNLTSYKENYMTTSSVNGSRREDDYFGFKNTWLSFSAVAGATIKEHADVQVKYQFADTFSEYVNTAFVPRMLQFQFNYRF
ncbi:hypothetical protein FPE01S_01_09790 [Flavihumibacter petaseus NBRC 106054]|uniref:Outer membrane protein beta-barrel domain-containing protein n=2 Tax=Flavihumibacter TaxID=1004301 RepID=A0A0E9MX27_9BACT|nr:hypothetical protein FPE01S_01_09790 [Flavihumibacter petaseus NBRC 106054]